MDAYGSKIGKVSRCRPAVSNETILATRQEFFFTKVAPVQSILLNVYFHDTLFIILMVIFQLIRYFFWLKKGPSIAEAYLHAAPLNI